MGVISRQIEPAICKDEALDGGCAGVPRNKNPPSPGQEKGARSKTTQGEGMRSTRSLI